MPWNARSAFKHTKAAQSQADKRIWAKTANAVLKATGDEGRAVRIANYQVKKSAAKRKA